MSDFGTLVKVSRLYYELGETQARIAELVGVTRPQVSRLLKEARGQGVVEIRIVDRTEQPSPAADVLRERFDLQAVHLAPSLAGSADLARRRVARLAAQVLTSAVRDGMLVGIGDGAAVSATADALDPSESPVDATIVPLCGGYWHSGAGREPFRRVADALGAGIHGLLAPGLLDDPTTRDALRAHAGVRTVAELWDGLDLALFGIGGPAWSEATVGSEALSEIEAGLAVGEVLIAPFDIEGRFVGETLRARAIAFDARQLPRVPVTIGVAEGPAKAGPILGALRAGLVKVLVSDVRTAEAVVALDGGIG
jgi:DNA-binding transcriptional regulator LsrR (DeoR family)